MAYFLKWQHFQYTKVKAKRCGTNSVLFPYIQRGTGKRGVLEQKEGRKREREGETGLGEKERERENNLKREDNSPNAVLIWDRDGGIMGLFVFLHCILVLNIFSMNMHAFSNEKKPVWKINLPHGRKGSRDAEKLQLSPGGGFQAQSCGPRTPTKPVDLAPGEVEGGGWIQAC